MTHCDILDDDSDRFSVEENEKLLSTSENTQNSRHSSSCLWTLLKVTSVATIIILLAVDVVLRIKIFHREWSYNDRTRMSEDAEEQSSYIIGNGFTSELPSLLEVVTYSPRNYSGILSYDSTTDELYREPDGPISYFGKPSAALEQNWKDLLEPRFPILLDSELEAAHKIGEDDHSWWDGKVHFEPDVFHTLHCLNAVRHQMNHILYPATVPAENTEKQSTVRTRGSSFNIMHTEHCLDRIRQSIMCNADLTPNPIKIFPGSPIAIGQPANRICRDWAPIKRWMRNRDAEGKRLDEERKRKDKMKQNTS